MECRWRFFLVVTRTSPPNRRGWDYPLHLGVTEAGEGEDGRMKSAIGIGALLMDGLGDTIRVSLTEDPEYELRPCNELAEVRALCHTFFKRIYTLSFNSYSPCLDPVHGCTSFVTRVCLITSSCLR